MKAKPIAANVLTDMWGASCRDCLGAVYVARITRGKPVYRHVTNQPPCLFDAKGNPR